MRTLFSSRVGLVVGVVAVGALACHSDCSGSAPTLPDASPLATSPATVVPPSDAAPFAMRPMGDAAREAPVDPLCAKVLAEEKLDASALKTDDRTRPGPRVLCVASPTVAWAVRVDPTDAGRSVRQTILFAGADGARARDVSTVANVEWPPLLGRRTAMYDFDGDGVPELFTVVPTDVRTFAPASRILVTYKGGKISPVPTGGGFLVDAVSDLDGDGRGDLRVSFELGKRTVCETGDEGQLTQEFEAHGLPGGKFSLTDEAAAAFAARRCPSMPGADTMFIPSMDPTRDPRDLSLQYVACSRLRGKSVDAVISELQTACAPNAEATKKCTGPCRHLPDALAVAKFAPPVQAKDAPTADAGRD